MSIKTNVGSFAINISHNVFGLSADFEFKKPKYMTKVDFTNWLHTEFDAVFHGDITPEQVMLNAIPMIDLFVSQNSGKPLVSGSLPPNFPTFPEACNAIEDKKFREFAGEWDRKNGAKMMYAQIIKMLTGGNER